MATYLCIYILPDKQFPTTIYGLILNKNSCYHYYGCSANYIYCMGWTQPHIVTVWYFLLPGNKQRGFAFILSLFISTSSLYRSLGSCFFFAFSFCFCICACVCARLCAFILHCLTMRAKLSVNISPGGARFALSHIYIDFFSLYLPSVLSASLLHVYPLWFVCLEQAISYISVSVYVAALFLFSLSFSVLLSAFGSLPKVLWGPLLFCAFAREEPGVLHTRCLARLP